MHVGMCEHNPLVFVLFVLFSVSGVTVPMQFHLRQGGLCSLWLCHNISDSLLLTGYILFLVGTIMMMCLGLLHIVVYSWLHTVLGHIHGEIIGEKLEVYTGDEYVLCSHNLASTQRHILFHIAN